MKKTIQILGSIFIATALLLSSCTKEESKEENSSLQSVFENMEYEEINEVNIDMPIGAEIVMMDDLDIKIGEIGENGEILLYKTKFIENYIDDDGNEYKIRFIGLSKDLKFGDIHYTIYDYSNINNEEDGFTVATMIDLRLANGSLNNDYHDCDKIDVKELRNGGVSITHKCESIDNPRCSRCVLEVHACGELKRCECSTSWGRCKHSVSITLNYNLGDNNMYGMSWIYAYGW